MLLVLVAAVALVAACDGGTAPPPAEKSEPTLEEQSPPDRPTPREGRNQGAAPDSTDDTTPKKPRNRPAPDDPNTARAVVERIVDGDTLEVRGLGSPLPRGRTVRVRLLEIDAPEQGTCFSTAATDRLAALVPLGSRVRVERDKDLKDPYGRYLLYVWNDQGRFVNRSLVSTGHAKAVLYEPNDKHWLTIVRAGDSARRGETGLWSACATKPSPPDVPAPPPDVPEPDVPEPDVPDVPEPDAPEPDAPEPDAPEPDAPEPDAPEPDAPEPDAPEPDVPEPDTPEPPDVPESPEDEEPPNDQGDSYPPGPPPGPDVDCSDLPGPVRVGPSDPHNLDADGDGIGCE